VNYTSLKALFEDGNAFKVIGCLREGKCIDKARTGSIYLLSSFGEICMAPGTTVAPGTADNEGRSVLENRG